MSSATTYLQLAIDVDSDPISGVVSNEGQGRQRFNGWIELVEAIEAARISEPDAARGRPR